MKGTSPKQATKPSLKVKALAPRKDPKGGGKNRPPGGDCDEFGCGTNHNAVFMTEARA